MSKKFSVKLFFLLFFFALAYRLLLFNVPLDRDEGGYAYLGWQWMSGQAIPYLNSFDHKFPPVFLVYGLASLFGNNIIGIRIMSIIFFTATFACFYFLSSRLTSKQTSLLATLLLAIYLSSIRIQGSHFNTESMYILPLIIFTFLIWKLSTGNKMYILSIISLGLLGSLAILFRPVAVYAISAFFIWLLYHKRRLKLVVYFTFGFLTPILSFLVYFDLHHATSKLIDNLIFYNQKYNSAGYETLLSPPTLEGKMLSVFNWLQMLPPVILPFFILSLIVLYKFRKNRNYLWWAGLIHLTTGWLGAKQGAREFTHYYLPLVLGLALSSLIVFEDLVTRKKVIIAVVITLFLAGWVLVSEIKTVIEGPLAVVKKEFGGEGIWFYDALKVSDWIKSNVGKDDKLLVWANEPEIYFYSERKSPSEHVNFYSFYNRPKEVKDNWLKAVQNNPPSWIITYADDSPSYNELMQLFPNMLGYKKIADIGKYIIFHKTNERIDEI